MNIKNLIINALLKRGLKSTSDNLLIKTEIPWNGEMIKVTIKASNVEIKVDE